MSVRSRECEAQTEPIDVTPERRGTRRTLLSLGLRSAAALAATSAVSRPALVRAATEPYSLFEFPGGDAERLKPVERADYTSALNEAVRSGSLVHLPRAQYPIRTLTTKIGCVAVVSDVPIDISCALGASIIAGAELSNASASLFSLRARGRSPVPLRFAGGFFDGSQLVRPSGQGIGFLDLYEYRHVIIDAVRGNGGSTRAKASDIGSGGADTMITTHNCFGERFTNIYGTGFFDTLLYLSGDKKGDILDGVGENAVIAGLTASRCGNAVVFKRDHVGQVVHSFHISECVNGIVGSQADGSPTNQGKRTHVSSGRLSRIQGRPIGLFGRDSVVSNVTVDDYGRWISDDHTLTPTALGNGVAGIDLRGCSEGHVHHNTIRLSSWRTREGEERDVRSGIALRKDAAGQATRDCVIRGNVFSGIRSPLTIGEGCEFNLIESNRIVGAG